MDQDNANNAANNALNLNDQNPPLPPIVNNQPPLVQQVVADGWNQYRLDPKAVDVTGAIVLPPLPPNTKFVISSGLL